MKTSPILTEARRLVHDLVGTSELADYTSTLKQGQKIRVAGFVRQHGYQQAMQALYVNPAELEQLMLDTGHARCEVCEEWFLTAEVVNSMCTGSGSCTEEMA